MSSLPFLARLVFIDSWPITVLGAGAVALAAAPAARAKAPDWRLLAAMFIGPVLLILWSALWFGQARDVTGFSWLGLVHHLLAVGSGGWILYLGMHQEQRKWWWLLAISAVTAVLLTAVAWFVGGMALVDDWI